VQAEKEIKENRSSSNSEFVEKVSEHNVKLTVQEILNRSQILKEMVENGEVGIVGGMYDITTGKVAFYQDTLEHNHESLRKEAAV
jgi:carbonic anhydrase